MSLYPHTLIAEVNALLDAERVLGLIEYRMELQAGADGLKGFCPIHEETLFRTLLVDKDRRQFRCLYGRCKGHQGGTLVDLYALATKKSRDEAVLTLARTFELPVNLGADEDFLRRNLEVAGNYATLGELREAERIYREIVEYKPESVAAHEGLLRLSIERADTGAQSERLETLARLHMEASRWDSALAEAKAWAEVAPESAGPARVLAQCALAVGDKRGAVYEFMAVADISEAAGDIDGALAAYEQVEQIQKELGEELIDIRPMVERLFRRGDSFGMQA